MAETKSQIDPEVLDDLLRGVDNERDLTGVLRHQYPLQRGPSGPGF